MAAVVLRKEGEGSAEEFQVFVGIILATDAKDVRLLAPRAIIDHLHLVL